MTTKRLPRLDLNPSSADRWTTCTASPRFILENWDKVPPSDTVYNQEGTTAHEVAAAMLEGREPDPKKCPTPINEDMRWHGWNYAEYVQSLRGPLGRLLVEQKLPLWYMKDRNAIVDAAVLNADSLHVVDFKYGEGVVVSPIENLQTAIYAVTVGTLGTPLPTDFPVYIHIYQPRGRAAEDGADHVWETTWLDVCKLTEKVTNVAQGIQDQTEIPMFSPSEKACQWCPAKGFCTARQQYLMQDIEVIQDKFILPFDENSELDRAAAAYIEGLIGDPAPEVVTRANELEHLQIGQSITHYPPAQAISAKQLSAVLTHKDQIIKWLNDAEEYATEFMRGGGKIPGFKLVLSRGGNRYWSDPKRAGELLLKDTVLKREEVIEEKVISPGAVEKLLGKKKFGVELTNLVAKAPGVPVIAPESDKREAIASAIEDFEVLPPEPTTQNE